MDSGYYKTGFAIQKHKLITNFKLKAG